MYSTAIEIITPEIASKYLETNTNNYRKISNPRVNAYALEMQNGNWKNNGEAIVFGTDGILKNGQHRLLACVKSNTPFETLVIRGCDETIYDAGYTRTTRQELLSENYSISTSCIGAVKLLFRILNNNARTPEVTIRNYIKHNIEYLNKASEITSCWKGISKKASCILVIYCMLKTKEIDDSTMIAFIGVLNSGNSVGCDEPSPALVARRQIMSFTSIAGQNQETISSIMIYALRDFKSKKQRIKNYYIPNGIALKELVNKVKEIDGINV